MSISQSMLLFLFCYYCCRAFLFFIKNHNSFEKDNLRYHFCFESTEFRGYVFPLKDMQSDEPFVLLKQLFHRWKDLI